MVTDQGQATLNFEPKFLSPELNQIGFPVEVRNSELRVVGRSSAPGSLGVKAPGKYYVLVRLPAGQEIAEEVEVIPGQTKTVSLAFDEEGVAQPGVDEVSRYLGLPERTLLPTEVQSKSARRRSPVASPSMAPPVATAAADPGEIAAKSSSLESLGVGDISVPAPPSNDPVYDPVDQLLSEYVSLTSPETALESMGSVIVPPAPAVIRTEAPPQRDQTPINLYLRLFRGNPLGLKTRALPADQWESGFESGSKGKLMLSGTQETSVLQVIQPGRPTLNIVLPLSPEAGCNVVIRRCVVSSPVRDEVSFDVHMSNVKADFFLRYSAQGMLTEASQLLRDEKQQQAMGQATQLLSDKYEDPVAAAVGAYGLLKFGNNDRRDWITRLCNDFSWLPDGAAIEAECLARESRNEESLRTFLQLADRGIPLFTNGLIFAVDRLESFTSAGSSGAPNEDIKRARSLLELLRTYSQFLDLNKQISRYTGRMPHLPSAEPASVTPELEKDGTILSLTLEGGDEGVVRIKPRSKPAVRRRSARAMETAEVKSVSVSDNQAERSEAVANLIQTNDPQSIALRVLHLASQSAETDVIADNVDENAVLERIVNVSPALGTEFLELGKLAARTVARVNAGSSFGTGFMVSPSLLLTTNRILPEPDIAAKTTVDFDYELSGGELKQPHTFKLEPDRFFLTNTRLDFTLVHVAARSTDLVPLSDFGFNRLNGELGKILCGESINIVHYPGGGLKSVLLRSGVLQDYVDDFLHYDAGTTAGSLGAAIFNDQWEVIGLHHAAVSVGGKPTNEGIRTSSILRACREAFVPDPAMQELLDQVFNPPDVVVSSSSNQPEPATAGSRETSRSNT